MYEESDEYLQEAADTGALREKQSQLDEQQAMLDRKSNTIERVIKRFFYNDLRKS